MLKKAALLAGVIFVVIGIAGFIPALTTKDDMDMTLLLGIFMVGGVHNIIHLLSGVAALFSAKSEVYAMWYFRIFGLVYGLVTLVGFIQGDTVLGIIDVNTADNFLHLGISLASLYLGFGVAASTTDAKPTSTSTL